MRGTRSPFCQQDIVASDVSGGASQPAQYIRVNRSSEAVCAQSIQMRKRQRRHDDRVAGELHHDLLGDAIEWWHHLDEPIDGGKRAVGGSDQQGKQGMHLAMLAGSR